MSRASRRGTSATVPPMTPPIHLHIERLEIEGLALAATDVARLRTAFEHELTALLAGRAPPPSDTAPPRLMHLAASGSLAAWGRQIAGQVYDRVAPQLRQATTPTATDFSGEGPP